MFTLPHRSRRLAAMLSITAASAVMLGSAVSAAAPPVSDTEPTTEAVDETVAPAAPVTDETVATEAPAPEAPVTDETAAPEAPVTDETVATEAPVTDETVAPEAPVTDETVAEQPAAEQPAAEQQTAELAGPSVATEAMLDATVTPLARPDDQEDHMTGAIWTTNEGGATVDENIYPSKDAVYLNGGPNNDNAHGLEPGTYYVQVTDPDGTSLGGIGTIQVGADGRFVQSYRLTDLVGEFADSHNDEYKVWVSKTDAFAPSSSKTDNFRVVEPDVPDPGTVSGDKYYDANTNGVWDATEPGIAHWQIQYTLEGSDTATAIFTDGTGHFSIDLDPGTYVFEETDGGTPWMQTGPNPDRTYTVEIVDGDDFDEIFFGNVALGAGNGHTLGFWSNKNGQDKIGDAELLALRNLNLVNANGTAFNPTTKLQVKNWLLSANATNMAYMLSAQLAAMKLNTIANGQEPTQYIYAPGVDGAVNGFITVADLMAKANESLAANPITVAAGSVRTYQEALKNALDQANNNNPIFVLTTPPASPFN